MVSRLTLSNRKENLKLLREFIQGWARERGLSAVRCATLEEVTKHLFTHLVTRAYPADQPGSIAVTLEEKGPRVRLMLEDDAPPYNPTGLNAATCPTNRRFASSEDNLTRVRQLADSMIYYFTPDRKNRLVVFLTM